MGLVREALRPKRATRTSVLAALPAGATAAWMATSPWLNHSEAALAVLPLEFLFLAFLFLGALWGGQENRFLRGFGVMWSGIALLVTAALLAWSLDAWWPLVGFAFFAASNLPPFLRRDAWARREVLMARGGIGFVLGWGLILVAGALSALAPVDGDPFPWLVAIWGGLFFGVQAVADALGVLSPDAHAAR